MNKVRRKKLADILKQLEQLEDQLREVQGEEQNAFDNLPESIQNSGKGEKMEEAISAIESAIDYFLDAANEISGL